MRFLIDRPDKILNHHFIGVLTETISNQLPLDLQFYNCQYSSIELELFSDAHDRFLIIDNTELYHIGASLKELGKKWFVFTRMDIEVGSFSGYLSFPQPFAFLNVIELKRS